MISIANKNPCVGSKNFGRFSEVSYVEFFFIFAVAISLINNVTEYAVLIFGLFAFGINHGSFDFQILKHQPVHRSRFILYFSLVFLASIILGLAYPTMWFVIFTILSAYHFASEDFDNSVRSRSSKLGRITGFTLLGLPIILLPTLRFSDLTSSLLNELVGGNTATVLAAFGSHTSSLSICLFCLSVISFWILNRDIKQLLFLICLDLILFYRGPIAGFGLYFCYYHSLKAFSLQKIQLKLSYFEAFRKSCLISLIAIGLSFTVFVAISRSSATIGLQNAFAIIESLIVAHILTRFILDQAARKPSASDRPFAIQ